MRRDYKMEALLDYEENRILLERKYKEALEAIRYGIAGLEAMKQGKTLDIEHTKRKMREVLFNASSEYRPVQFYEV